MAARAGTSASASGRSRRALAAQNRDGAGAHAGSQAGGGRGRAVATLAAGWLTAPSLRAASSTGVRERFEASTDFTVGIEEEYQLLDPVHPGADQPLRGHDGRGRRAAARPARGRADRLRDRVPHAAPPHLRRRRPRPGRGAPRDARAGRPAGPGARRVGRPPVQPVDRAAHHRHAALPARRGGARLHRLDQQHLVPAPARGGARRRPGRRRSRPRCAACCRSCWPCRPTARSSSGRATRLHSTRVQVFTKSFPRCGVPDAFADWDEYAALRRAARAHRLDRREHADLVERAPAPQLRHGRGAHLRRPDRDVARPSPWRRWRWPASRPSPPTSTPAGRCRPTAAG